MVKNVQGLHAKYPFLLSDFNEVRVFSTDFQKTYKCQMSLNPSSGSRFVPCGQKDGQTDRQTDMT
jgi:hypothetical protein